MRRTKWFLIGTLVVVATIQICFGLPSALAETGEKPLPYNVGQWLPSDQQALEDWRADLIRETDALGDDAPLLPVIQEFKKLIENDPELFMLFTQMFEQVPHKPPFLTDPTGKPQIRRPNGLRHSQAHCSASMMARQKAGRSSGVRELIRFPS